MVHCVHRKKDPVSNKWCADPELGLSSFGFDDEKTYVDAIERMKYYNDTDKIALFKSYDYSIGSGLDGEDVFRNGTFIRFISVNSKFEDIFN